MKWLIIVFIIMSLIGSVMWVMPTPRQKFQAQLRLKARALGFQVQLVQLHLPRQRGEVEPETPTLPAYRLMRQNLSRQERDALTPWRVCRVDNIANTGLPEGWSWSEGEGALGGEALKRVRDAIATLPEDVLAIESTPLQLSVFWNEGDEAGLTVIKDALMPLLEAKV